MFTESSEEHMAGTAIKSGVNAYIVDGLKRREFSQLLMLQLRVLGSSKHLKMS